MSLAGLPIFSREFRMLLASCRVSRYSRCRHACCLITWQTISHTKENQDETMNTALRKLLIFTMSLAALSILGCSSTADTNEAYLPPPDSRVVHVPTGVTTVPPSTDSTTETTRYSNGAVQQRTTTAYNPGYTTAGPPYRTTVVPSSSVPPSSSGTTRSTTTTYERGNVVQQQTTTTIPGY